MPLPEKTHHILSMDSRNLHVDLQYEAIYASTSTLRQLQAARAYT